MHKTYTLLVWVLGALPYTLVANMLPQNVLTKNCLNSYENSYLPQNDHKAFVYAREKETDKDRCNWGYGYATVEEAIDSAMKGCQSVMLNAECMLIDSDGNFTVPDGTFTPLVPVDNTPLTKEEIDTRMKEAKSVVLGNCLPFFEKYLSIGEHKSFGYSVDVYGNYACGYSYNNQSIKISKKQAIKSCQNNKAKRGKKAPKSACKVYATNKTILLSAKDYDIKPLAKEKVLSKEAYDKNLKQAHEIIKSWPCLIQYKYFLKSKVHNAFYLVQNEDAKQMCGRSEGAFTVDVAKQKAKESCEKHARDKQIKGECKLLAVDLELVGTKEMFKLSKKQTVVKTIAPKQEKKADIKPLAQKKVKNAPQSSTASAIQTAQPIEKALALASTTMNKTLPSMIDAELRLDKVTSKNKRMTFHYTIMHYTNWTMPKNKLHGLLYEDTKSQVCADKDTQGLLKKGAVIAYSYRGKNKNSIDTFVFDAKACGLKTNLENLRNLLKNIGKK